MNRLTFIWCTYRTWSFAVLEGLLDLPDWRCGLIVTTETCTVDLSGFERIGIPVLRTAPETAFRPGYEGLAAAAALEPAATFHYGWSWIVPSEMLALCPNVTLHPGRLPLGRGGSPIQNQIRQGWDWTDANIIELVAELDEGDIYASQRFSLNGEDADAVWARMVSVGILLTRRFLIELGEGRLAKKPQGPGEGSLFKRVRPEDSRLDPGRQSAREMYDIVRAHNETDANTYVRRAWLPLTGRDLVIDRATLEPPLRCNLTDWTALDAGDEAPFTTCHAVNDGALAVRIPAADGGALFATRIRLRAAAVRN